MSNFNIYKASAGSGKTYTLVKEYIKKSLINDSKISHKPLLAITFTNKAASEMKSRIISSLFYFFNKNNTDSASQKLYEDLKLELGYSDKVLQDKSKKILLDIIHYYGLFSVSTIDKFVHKVIKGFSYELDLPSSFTVEMDQDKIIQEGVSSIIDEAGIDPELTNSLLKYSSYKTNENKKWDIEEDLFQVSKELFKDQKFIFINKVSDVTAIKSVQKILFSEINFFEKEIENVANKIKKLIQGISTSSFYYKDLPNYLKKINKKPYSQIEISDQFNKRLYNSIKKNKWYKNDATSEDKKSIDNISSDLHIILNDLTQFLQSRYSAYRFYKQCYHSFFLVSVLSKIDEKIEHIKKENNIIHISEFNQIILRFLKESPVPFIYEKIGTKYHHYFIDEFQDTSLNQWENLIPLVEEGLSTGGSCLIVGDGKQSIYRWRGGDVKQFLELCGNQKGHSLKNFSKKIMSLDTNYRSAKQIVDFNNNFFSFLSDSLIEEYKKLYHNLSQKSYNSHNGYIEISMLDSQGEKVIDETLQKIYAQIQETINDGYSFSDIVILTRNKKDITKIATFLTEHEIPIVSSESLLLKNSKTVQFLLNNLTALLDNFDYLNRARLLKYLIVHNIIICKNTSLHSFVAKNSQLSNRDFEYLLESFGINYNFDYLRGLNIYEIIENLIRIFNLDSSSNLYISFFLDFVFEFSVNQNNSISDFLNFWDQQKNSASVIMPGGINSIEIMTIHKSKGLQFPVVIFPFANWKDDLGKDKKWFNVSPLIPKKGISQNMVNLLPLKKEIEDWPEPFPTEYKKHKKEVLLDNINLLYVAMTRPKDRLYIISNSDNRKGGIYKYFYDYFYVKNIDINKGSFIMGDRIQKIHPPSESTKSIFLKNNISEDWRSRIRIRKKHIFNKNIKQKYSIDWGDLIHNIMSHIYTAEDISLILKNMDIELKYGKEACQRISREISTVINDKRIKHLFKKDLQVFSETSILTKEGMICRPDRVVLHSQNEASLIDYKTGEETSSHTNQMLKYQTVLSSLGYQKINKYLVYLTTSKIKKL